MQKYFLHFQMRRENNEISVVFAFLRQDAIEEKMRNFIINDIKLFHEEINTTTYSFGKNTKSVHKVLRHFE